MKVTRAAEGAGSPSSPCQQREVGDEVADFQRLSSNLLDLAAIMSVIATIEQEFQEIDDANDWQPRYLVSEGWGAGGKGKFRNPEAASSGR